MASKANHQPCAKQDTNTQLMRKLISHVFTQDMTTWKHAANEYTSCVPHSTRQHECTQQIKTRTACHNTKRMWTEERAAERVAERTWDRTLTQRDRTWSASVQTPTWTETQDMSAGIRTPRYNTKQVTQTRALEATHSHKNRTWRECQGSVTKPMNDTRPKWQNPDNLRVKEILHFLVNIILLMWEERIWLVDIILRQKLYS